MPSRSLLRGLSRLSRSSGIGGGHAGLAALQGGQTVPVFQACQSFVVTILSVFVQVALLSLTLWAWVAPPHTPKYRSWLLSASFLHSARTLHTAHVANPSTGFTFDGLGKNVSMGMPLHAAWSRHPPLILLRPECRCGC